MTKQVLAVFPNEMTAEAAADRLLAAGVAESQISVLMDNLNDRITVKNESKAPEGATTGAVLGGALGAIALGASAIGTIVLPGVGVLAGPLVAAAAGGAAGAATGGVAGGLIGLGIPEHEAKAHATAIREGGVLLGVEVMDGDKHDVKRILKDAGGKGISVEKSA
jgi:uncharacterized membrane protein